ncbi:U5 snRNP-associated protein Prp18 [Schizosaccharomyces japonicus yFS275]|uniref:Pre-mRNA-splicing factor 18 n=1 Tax=Schizosaccharomyces japonicus (strain yFS275 / FY16936) TaxID=402676 RepID=B6K2I4_SCHJY|nr:U5 snRNP-associated protein Prp18 [Schizosaccharomyces japonicus yFS275]EEB07365.1 U5 snRNP-associated protein Prp18 [Schizosaccharomyces japonicus yFS275]
MDFLKEEIERKRRQIQADGELPVKRAFRRGDLEKAREEKYREEQAQREKEREKKRKQHEEELQQMRQKLIQSKTALQKKTGETRLPSDKEERKAPPQDATTEGSSDAQANGEDTVPISTIQSQLRAMKKPIRLFGENEDMIRTRWKSEQKEQRKRDLEQELKNQRVEIIEWERCNTQRSKVARQLIVFIRHGLRLWQEFFAKKSIEELDLSTTKAQYKVFQQASQHLELLINKIIDDQIDNEVFERVAEICYWCQKEEFVKANDAYLRVSIGNAPWPIGVTMVGIHERSSRERLTAHSVGHVLNDEMTRKWLQALKRLVTFFDKERPLWKTVEEAGNEEHELQS